MVGRPRNPSPPDDDFDFFSNLHIKFLQPSYSSESLELSLELLHKNLFISPASENETEPIRNIISDSNPRHENEPEPVADSSSKNQKSSYSLKEIRKKYRDKKARECLEPCSLEPEKRTSKKKGEKKKEKSSKHSVAVDEKHISDEKRRRHHKSSKHTKRRFTLSDESNSEESESLKPRKYSSRSYRNISGSEDSSHHSSRKKSHRKNSRHERRRYKKESDLSSSDRSNSRSPHRRNLRRERDLSSDRSDSLGYKHRNPKSDLSGGRNLRKDLSSDESDSLGYKHKISKSNLSGGRNLRKERDLNSDGSDSLGYKHRNSKSDLSGGRNLRKERDFNSDGSDSLGYKHRNSKSDLSGGRNSRKEKDISSDGSDSLPLGHKQGNSKRDLLGADESNSRGPSSNVDLKSQYFHRNNDNPDSDRSDSERMDLSPQDSREDTLLRIKSEPDEFDEESKYNPETDEYWDHPEFFGPESFFCKVCQLDLNSQCTYESHMKGKKHKKALKTFMIPAVVKGSLDTLEQLKEGSLAPGSKKTEHVVISDVSELQSTVDNHTKNPIAGLEFVKEIRNAKDISYFCDLCDAPCMIVSIMPHLLGFKHQLNCMKVYFNDFYVNNKDRSKKEIEKAVINKLMIHERIHGRGKITVVKVVQDYSPLPPDQPGPSWRYSARQDMPENQLKPVGGIVPIHDLDPTKSDYYCGLCDAHMNNINMYSAHLVGKRHLKTVKKKAGERGSATKGTKAPPGVTSELERLIEHNKTDVIIGLEFIREMKNENGELYTCYICGSSCTLDILDHLVSVKHRVKYLETVDADGSKPNAITTINALEGNFYTREALVLDECSRLETEYGRGKVELYVSKSAANRF